MAISTILLFTIIMVSMNGINSQLLDAVRAEDLTSILHEIFEDQLVNHNVTTDLLHNYTNTLTRMVNAIVHMEDTQSYMASDLNQSARVQTRMEETLNLMAVTQSQIANDLNLNAGAQTRMEETLINIVKTLKESMDTQHHIEDTLDQMANTFTRSTDTQNNMNGSLDQIANTQTQIANALTEVVSLLRMQNEQLQNTMATTTDMDQQLSTQNPIISLQPNTIIDCSDLASRGPFPSGTYTIQSRDNLRSFPVYCDMDTDDGGWTVFQKRFDGTVNFYRGWDAYEDGFGSPDVEYWLGLRQLHHLTQHGDWTLRIDLQDFHVNTAFAEFELFSVGDAASHYRLSIGGYSGTAGDALTYHNNQPFSTKDSDHDASGGNCAQNHQGAWWYQSCVNSNLNGRYNMGDQNSPTGNYWYQWKHDWEGLKGSEMKIRRTQ